MDCGKAVRRVGLRMLHMLDKFDLLDGNLGNVQRKR